MQRMNFILWALFLNVCLWPISIFAQTNVTFTTLVQFNGTNGGMPNGGLIQGRDGNFYGTTTSGGQSGNGTIFQMTSAGVLTTLLSFDRTNNGGFPEAALVQGPDGGLYGTTKIGGTGPGQLGTVFRITTNGAFSTLCSFADTNGSTSWAELVQGPDGQLYGTTLKGGYEDGTIFKITTNGVLTSLFWLAPAFSAGHTITNTGIFPISGLVVGNDGDLYGTTEYTASPGGDNGTIFKIDTNGTLRTLVIFKGTNGSASTSTLTVGRDGNFYGLTTAGGASGLGTVFRMTAAGVLTTLFSFSGTNGTFQPTGQSSWKLVQGTDGNFYGETVLGGPEFTGGPGSYGHGTLFRITPNGVFTSLYYFGGASSVQYTPVGGLIQAADGNFYGVTRLSNTGLGCIFRLTVPLQPSLQSMTVTNGALILAWNAVAGENYQLQYATDLTSSNWVDWGGSILATNGIISQTDIMVANSLRFYRIVLLP